MKKLSLRYQQPNLVLLRFYCTPIFILFCLHMHAHTNVPYAGGVGSEVEGTHVMLIQKSNHSLDHLYRNSIHWHQNSLSTRNEVIS